MGGAAAVGAGLGIMGGTLGGIGDIIQAQNYQRPKLEKAFGAERRLRDLATAQFLGGGQQALGGTALYNQMVPMLMGMLPGMTYHPGAGGGESLGGVADAAGGGGGGGGGLPSYQEALQTYQDRTALEQQLGDLKRARRKAPTSPEKKAYKVQVKALKKQLKSQPTVQKTQRRMYLAGTSPANADIYDIRMGGGGGSGPPSGGPPAAGGGGGQSLGAIQGMMDAMRGTGPDLSKLYQQGMGG